MADEGLRTTPPLTDGVTQPEDEVAQPYVLVWNDPVDLKQLSTSVVICSTLSLTTFLLARSLIGRVVSTESLTGGYALLAGLVGCVAAAAFCARLFRPKRTFSDEANSRRSAAVAELEALGGTAEAFDQLPDTVKDEMVEIGLAPTSVSPTAKALS